MSSYIAPGGAGIGTVPVMSLLAFTMGGIVRDAALTRTRYASSSERNGNIELHLTERADPPTSF